MFKAEKLSRVTLQVPESAIAAVTRVLAQFRLLHLVRIEETPLGPLGYRAEIDGDLLQEYDGLILASQKLLSLLQVPALELAPDLEVIPEKEVFRVREELAQLQQEIEAAGGVWQGVEQQLTEKRQLLEKLQLLPAELDLTALAQLHLVNWAIGLVPTAGLDKLHASLAAVHHVILEGGQHQQQSVVLVLALKKDWPVVERALTAALFEALTLPQGLTGSVADNLATLTTAVAALEARQQEAADQRRALQQRYGRQIQELAGRLAAARQLLLARRLFGKVDSSFIISGWLPARLLDDLKAALEQVTDGQLLFEQVNPEDIREVRTGIIQIPILFNNPLLISPFEKLTTLYGWPRYREVEPTVFFALSFLLLFGLMFGDVGQGAVLFLLGYLVFRRSYRYLDYGIILMECGVSAAFFGVLYGSVFGLETVLPALWFRPIENIPYLIKVALGVGVSLISLGLILNVINAIRLREYEKLFSASGLAGAILYWLGVGLAVKYLVSGRVEPWELRVIGWLTVGLVVLMVVQRPLWQWWQQHQGRAAAAKIGWGTAFLEGIIEIFDDLLQFIANTVSFIRVAAFALAHTALFIAVFSVAQVLSRQSGQGLAYWLTIALGNVIIILLEGLIVSIQTVRLEYYEFFGKFFRGGGEPFQPFDQELRQPPADRH